MKIAVLSIHTSSLFWFRMDMMKDFIKKGHSVIALGPESESIWNQKFNEYGIKAIIGIIIVINRYFIILFIIFILSFVNGFSIFFFDIKFNTSITANNKNTSCNSVDTISIKVYVIVSEEPIVLIV